MRYYVKGDCIQGMKVLPDGFFDLAIVDLPQGDGTAKKIAAKVADLNNKNFK